MSLPDTRDLPNIVAEAWEGPDRELLAASGSAHRPRVLLLYGSLRERSYSRFLTQEAARLLEHFGAEARIFDPAGLFTPHARCVRIFHQPL